MEKRADRTGLVPLSRDGFDPNLFGFTATFRAFGVVHTYGNPALGALE